MNTLEMNALRLELFQGNPQTISQLLARTGGSNRKLMKFFKWMYNQPKHLCPMLSQGDDDEGDYQGQPVVWDGTFSLDVDGELIYEGHAGASGFGGEVRRVVKVTDQVMVG